MRRGYSCLSLLPSAILGAISQTLPDGHEILYSYDANNNLTSITPPARPPHGFGYTPVNLEATYTPTGPTLCANMLETGSLPRISVEGGGGLRHAAFRKG